MYDLEKELFVCGSILLQKKFEEFTQEYSSRQIAAVAIEMLLKEILKADIPTLSLAKVLKVLSDRFQQEINVKK